jgi:hypothetical protein
MGVFGLRAPTASNTTTVSFFGLPWEIPNAFGISSFVAGQGAVPGASAVSQVPPGHAVTGHRQKPHACGFYFPSRKARVHQHEDCQENKIDRRVGFESPAYFRGSSSWGSAFSVRGSGARGRSPLAALQHLGCHFPSGPFSRRIGSPQYARRVSMVSPRGVGSSAGERIHFLIGVRRPSASYLLPSRWLWTGPFRPSPPSFPLSASWS